MLGCMHTVDYKKASVNNAASGTCISIGQTALVPVVLSNLCHCGSDAR